MSGPSKIEWTEQTWNPIVGCSIISPGCTHCYAMRQAPRTDALSVGAPWAGNAGKLTKSSKAGPVWTGALRLVERRLLDPLRRKKPTTYFVNSMGDLFHEDVPDEWIDKVFAVMALSPQHTFQVLTKRAERMRAYMTTPERGALICGGKIDQVAQVRPWPAEPCSQAARTLATEQRVSARNRLVHWPLPNVWLGVSAERQQEWDERSEYLRATPAAVTFVSCEPLLGPIRFHPCRHCNHPGNVTEWPCRACKGRRFEIPDWVIVGGESGPGARPFNFEWADSIVEQCSAADVPCFVKQLGSSPMSAGYPHPLKDRKGGDPAEWPGRLWVREMPERVRA